MSYPVADTQLATAHELPPAVVMAFREESLMEGVHWGRDGNRIVYTEKGRAAVASMAARVLAEKKTEGAAPSPPGTVDPAPETPAPVEAPAEAPLAHQARLLHKHPNATWIRCEGPGRKPVDVLIRSHAAIRNERALIPIQQIGGVWYCTHPHHIHAKGKKALQALAAASSSSPPAPTGATSTPPTT